MRLTDEVEVWKAGVPALDRYGNTVPGDYGYVSTHRANVSYTLTEREAEPGRVDLKEELRALVQLQEWDSSTMRLKWNGRMFYSDGPALVRRRNGRTHHLTIPLSYV